MRLGHVGLDWTRIDHTVVPGVRTTKLGQTSLQVLLACAGSHGAPRAGRPLFLNGLGSFPSKSSNSTSEEFFFGQKIADLWQLLRQAEAWKGNVINQFVRGHSRCRLRKVAGSNQCNGGAQVESCVTIIALKDDVLLSFQVGTDIFPKMQKHSPKGRATMPRNSLGHHHRPEVSGDWNLWGSTGQHPICHRYGLILRAPM